MLNFDGVFIEPAPFENYGTNFYDAIQGAFGRNTLSTVVRRDCINHELLEKSFNSNIGDIYVMVGASLKGKGYVFNDNMGVYRHHAGGASKNYSRLFYFHSRLGIFKYLEESLEETDLRKVFYRAFAFRFAKQEFIWIVKTGNFHLLKYVLKKYHYYKNLNKKGATIFEESQFKAQFRHCHKSMRLSSFDILKAIVKFITKKHYIQRNKSPYA